MPAQNQHLADFLADVRRLFQPERVDTFWECEPAFKRMSLSPLAREALVAELAATRDDPSYSGAYQELLLHQGGGTALSVSLLESAQRYLHALPYHAMFSVLGNAGLPFDRYSLPKDFRNELFNPSLTLIRQDSGVLAHGDVLRAPCGELAVDLQVREPVLVIKFVTTALLPLEWLFKRDTLQAWQANDADISFTQLRVAADVLGKIAHQSSIPPLKLMSRHGHHAVRWAAITNLGRINRSEAVLSLREAVNDPHPHVRNAAIKTLQRLEPR